MQRTTDLVAADMLTRGVRYELLFLPVSQQAQLFLELSDGQSTRMQKAKQLEVMDE